MEEPAHSDTPPIAPPKLDDHRRPRAPSMVGTPVRALGLCLVSVAVMAPWPLLGILLTRSSFDRASEAFGLFGGITLFPLLILALFSVSDNVIFALVMLVWCAAAVIPDLWFRRRLTSWRAIGVLLGVQSAFSLAQAVMGALLIFGKNV